MVIELHGGSLADSTFAAAGTPMAISIAGMYAKAWLRERFGWWQRLMRGTGWFALLSDDAREP